jgi:hypothetical protein
MAKQILTLDSLYQFFVEQNKTVNFSSKEAGKPIVVTTNGYFETDETEMPGMLKLELKVCHTETNRNGSHISTENMEKAMPTLKYRPILAYIHELEDGTKDFYAHNIDVIENEDGESEIVYIEKQVGCFTADEPWLKYDKKKDKTYVHAYAVIPEGYTEAADIIRRKDGTKVSCELVIDELSYNAKEKYLDLTSFYFGGCTLLGVDENGNEIGEGMLGARADIADFCHEEPTYTYQDKMIEVLEKLNITLSNFNTNTTQKGGNEMNKFEELLAKYGITAEEVTFEIEGLSDEELEAKFAEAFEGDDGAGEDEGDNGDGEGNDTDGDNSGDGDGEGENDDDGNDGDGEGAGDDGAGEGENTGDGEPEKFTKTFTVELSHDDIRNALYVLIRQYETEDEYYYIREVFDSYFIMQDWYNNKIYKQGYAVDGEDVSLDGDRVEVFEILVTEEEKNALDALKENYSALEARYNELKAFKDNYDAAELKAKKDAILGKEEYSILADNEAFNALKADADKLSIEEVEAKAKAIFADHVIETGTFSSKSDEKKTSKTIRFNFNKKETKRSPYGNLFNKD